jgi:hypothetical protein
MLDLRRAKTPAINGRRAENVDMLCMRCNDLRRELFFFSYSVAMTFPGKWLQPGEEVPRFRQRQ